MTIAKVLKAKWRAFSYYAGGYPRPVALFRWAVWAVHCVLKVPTIVTIGSLGLRLYLRPEWAGCWRAVYVFRDRFFEIADPELRFMQRTLRPGDVVADVGAFHGWYALVASKVVGEHGRVLAFEPNPETFAVLTRNIALNKCNNVRAFDMALSEADGFVTLFQGPNDGSTSSLAPVPGGSGSVKVPTRRLDSLLEELGISRMDFMKIDIQGGEAYLFRGAVGLLETSHPVIVFELAPEVARDLGVAEREAWDALAGLGYRFFALADSSLKPLREFPTLVGGAFLNVIAVPDGRPSG